MATVVGNNQVKLNNGQIVTAQTGGWYDGQQYWNGSLSNPGEFNTQNDQQGQQGQASVTPSDQSYINQQRSSSGLQTINYSAPTSTPQTSQSSGVSPSAFSFSSQPQIPNFQSIYESAYNEAANALKPSMDAAYGEVSSIQARIEEKRRALAEAEAGINDNPYYSEATRTGRIAKLRMQAQDDMAIDESELAIAQNKVGLAEGKLTQAKADAQIKLNIAAQQYNVQSQQYQQNLTMVNNLLTTGALSNASDSDVAQIALMTGMTTSMVRSIISTSKAKNEVKPQLITVDDGKNQKLVAVDSNGKVISETVLGASTKTSSGGGGNTNSTMDIQKLYDKYDTEIQKILKEVDVMNSGGEDKLLSDWEQETAVQRVMSALGINWDIAWNLVSKGFDAGGYHAWKG